MSEVVTVTDPVQEVVTGQRSVDDALTELFQARYPAMVRLAHLLVGDRGAAEEIAQEGFVRLHGRLAGLADPDAAGAYLRVVVLNLSRSHLRRRRLSRRHDGAAAGRPGAVGDVVLGPEDRDRVLTALRSLSRRQRECLVLRYYADLPEAEIARTLRISAGSVKTHTARGLAAMADLLGDKE